MKSTTYLSLVFAALLSDMVFAQKQSASAQYVPPDMHGSRRVEASVAAK